MLQFPLPGMDRSTPQPSLPRHRLFLAVFLPDDASTQLAALTQELRSEYELYGTALDRNRLHVSLLSLGDYIEFPYDVSSWVQNHLKAMRLTRCTANFDRVSSLSGRSHRPCRCPIAVRDGAGGRGLKEMQRTIASSLGFNRRSSFMPHVTLMYDDQSIPEMPVRQVNWSVTELALIHSKINRGRLQPYSILGRWLLN